MTKQPKFTYVYALTISDARTICAELAKGDPDGTYLPKSYRDYVSPPKGVDQIILSTSDFTNIYKECRDAGKSVSIHGQAKSASGKSASKKSAGKKIPAGKKKRAKKSLRAK